MYAGPTDFDTEKKLILHKKPVGHVQPTLCYQVIQYQYTTWSELQQSPLDPARPGADVLEWLPVVLPHLKEPAHHHPRKDPEPVAQEDVEDEVVPPALVKVGKEVTKRHL